MKLTRSKVFLFLVAGAAALGIAGGIAVAATLSTAHAHGGFGGSSNGGASFAARVADKLNDALGLDEDITEAQVQTAFNGVIEDRQDEVLEARLDDLEVADDTKTEITDWFGDYPYSDLIQLRTIGLASSDNVSGYLERLVEKERITQAQSDGIQSWYDDRPDLPEGLERSRAGKHNRNGDGAGTYFRGRHGRGGDGANTFFRGRFGRGGDGPDSFFRGRFRGGDTGQVTGNPL